MWEQALIGPLLKMTNPPVLQRKYYKKWYYKDLRHTRKVKNAQQFKTAFGGNRDLVLWRDGYRCVKCATTSDLTVDHIDRNRKNNELSNLQVLCRSCHGRKDGQSRKVKSGWKWRLNV